MCVYVLLKNYEFFFSRIFSRLRELSAFSWAVFFFFSYFVAVCSCCCCCCCYIVNISKLPHSFGMNITLFTRCCCRRSRLTFYLSFFFFRNFSFALNMLKSTYVICEFMHVCVLFVCVYMSGCQYQLHTLNYYNVFIPYI